MRLTHQSLSGLLFVVVASAAFTAPAFAGESATKSESSTTIAQTETKTEMKTQNAAVEEAVSRVREVYAKICSTKTRAAVPAPKMMAPDPVAPAMKSTPMPQMW